MAGEVCIELIEQDYVDANRAWLLLYLRRPRILARYALLLGGIAVVLASLEWRGGGGLGGVIRLATFAVVGGGAGLLLCHGLSYLLLPRRARRIFRQTASLGKPYHYSWSEQGIDYRSEGDNGRRVWADFYRWCDSPKVVLLMLNEQLFYIIPRRALNAAQAEDLRATVAARGPPRF